MVVSFPKEILRQHQVSFKAILGVETVTVVLYLQAMSEGSRRNNFAKIASKFAQSTVRNQQHIPAYPADFAIEGKLEV
jgi:hypothetical protein